MRHSRSRGLPVLVGMALLTVATSASARTIECASRDYQYQYCRVDTRGEVKLIKQISDSECRRGNTWGYDRNGIWVDDGCEARFRVGFDNDDRNDDDDDDDDGPGLGTAAAVVGGIALLGSLMGNRNNPYQQGVDPSSYGQQQPYGQQQQPYGQQQQPYGQQGTYSQTPNWAVGIFRGFSPAANTEVELHIQPDGSVVGYANGQQVEGFYQEGRIVMAGVHYYLEQSPQGIRTVRVDGSSQPVTYQRIR